MALATVDGTAAHIALTDHGCRLFLCGRAGDRCCDRFFGCVTVPAALDAVPAHFKLLQSFADRIGRLAVKINFIAAKLGVVSDFVSHKNILLDFVGQGG